MPSYRQLYPAIEPHSTGLLPARDGHEIYYEESGNPNGTPGVYIHGGPGAGSNPDQRRVFDPDRYRIILFDQRGCGKSRPHASLENNTTWDLIADMEHLRQHLGIDRWLVCGGSWGSALSMAYAQTHPECVIALILRGIFTLRRKELEWYYQGGAGVIFPDEWEKFIAPIPEAERDDMIGAFYRRLTSGQSEQQSEVAKIWSMWEGSTINLLQRPAQIENYGNDAFSIAFARIETHYFYHGGFFERDDWLLSNVESMRKVPTTIIQGRYDVCTPMMTAWDLHKLLPEAEFKVVDDAGHAFDEPGIAHYLVNATDRYAG